jgi:hypothetical protein
MKHLNRDDYLTLSGSSTENISTVHSVEPAARASDLHFLFGSIWIIGDDLRRGDLESVVRYDKSKSSKSFSTTARTLASNGSGRHMSSKRGVTSEAFLSENI